MAAAFQQANDASFFVRIGYAIDDPEFLAAREGGFVVQNEQGVVEGLALRCRGSRSLPMIRTSMKLSFVLEISKAL
jgi:hypothetical protein